MSARLWLTLVLSCAGAACGEEKPTWEVDPWAIPRTGGFWQPDAGHDDDAGPTDAGMDAELPISPDENILAIFDPAQVYLFGSIYPAGCNPNAIAPVLKSDEFSRGVPCYADLERAQIRPGDGRLLYIFEDALYQFSADVGSVMGEDILIPTEACSRDEAGSLEGFLISVTGKLYYRCANDDWYDENDQFVARIGGPVLQIAANGSALMNGGVHPFASTDEADHDGGTPDASVDGGGEPDAALEAGTQEDAGNPKPPASALLRRFVGMPSGVTVLASRVRPDGYWLALFLNTQTVQLWHVDFESHASLVGSYPATRSGQLVQTYNARLDSEGRLLQTAHETQGTFREIVLRRSIAGENATVWDEQDSAQLKLDVGYLVTGP